MTGRQQPDPSAGRRRYVENVPVPFEPASLSDADGLRSFLRDVDLTLAGVEEPTVRIWVERDGQGAVIGTTGFETSEDSAHALIRSVAVAPAHRARGAGSRLARFALEQARATGAERTWLFSRRSGPFWQSLGFTSADRDELATALPRAHQVRLFTASGQLDREVAWSLPLVDSIPACAE